MEHIVIPRGNHIPNPTQNPTKNTLEDHCINQFYKFYNLPSGGSKCINLGYVLPIEHPSFIIWFMDNWVNWMDAKLDRLQPGTNEFADIFGYRGFKYSEFKLLVSAKLGEDYFGRHRVFDYCFLTDVGDREFFTVANTDDDDELRDSYLKAVKAAIELEIEPLRFFLKRKIPFNVSLSSLKRSTYILGRSGTGKSELIKIMIYEAVRRSQKYRNRSVILLDPHGDLAQEALAFSLNRGKYRNRVVYLDANIRNTAREMLGYDFLKDDYTYSINPFDLFSNNSDQDINYMTQELSSAFFEILKNEATTQMNALIEACVEALLRHKNTSISDLKRFMDDSENEGLLELLDQIPNEERRKMATRIKNDSKLAPTKSGIYYRLQTLIGDSGLRRLLVNPSSVNLEREMNAGKFIIFNFAKAKMGQQSSAAMGKLMLALIQGYAIKRQELPKEKRKETLCFVDEFHNYVTPSVRQILPEGRKFALHMILAHQVIKQEMDTAMMRAILGNTGVKIAGDNERDSLNIMAENMGRLSPESFDKLPPYAFYVYDKQNKKRGEQILRVPDFLVKQQPPFYQTKSELESMFLWLVNESGYYRKVEDLEVPSPIEVADSENVVESNNAIYNPKFND